MNRQNAAIKLCFTVLSQISIALVFALFTPLIIRYYALPSSIHQQYPLNIVVKTCEDDLHSVCSFPTATLEYEKSELFSPNVVYYINIQLKFADLETSNRLGFFQNTITLHNNNGHVLKRFTKSAYVKQPGFFTRIVHTVFFPLYLLGFFHDYSVLQVPMSAEYSELFDKESTQFVYTLQDKFANVEDAQLIVTARFGFIRHFLYYWPSTSYAVIFLAAFIVGCSILAAKWAYFQVLKKEKSDDLSDEQEDHEEEEGDGDDERRIQEQVVREMEENQNHVEAAEVDGRREPQPQPAPEPREPAPRERAAPRFAPDEYMPDNYDYSPQYEDLYPSIARKIRRADYFKKKRTPVRDD